MKDPRNDLADLLADVLALAQDSGLRGVVYEGPSQSMPAPLAIQPAHSGAWSSLASQARDSAEVASVAGAAGLRAVREDLGECRRCRLCTDRSTLVFGVGNATADLMIIGHAPNRQEDMRGEPFVSDSGDMLDKMLAHVIGLQRHSVYITTTVKCRPSGDRKPSLDEIRACHPYLQRQIKAVEPKVILVMGTLAFQILFRTNESLTANRGKWKNYGGIPVMPTFHPSHLLSQAADKKPAFADLKAVRARYDELGGQRS
ncbi:MAG: uracil-DNA glycosylase family 4 [Myxococcota bacterium]|jgi:DNA polymerase